MSEVALDAMLEACSRGLTDRGAGLGYSDEALAAVRASFDELRKGAHVEAATRELLLFAFFLHSRKQSPGAARALVEIATTAAPQLHARGRSLDGVLASGDAQARLRALGLTTPAHDATKPNGGVSLLELLSGRAKER